MRTSRVLIVMLGLAYHEPELITVTWRRGLRAGLLSLDVRISESALGKSVKGPPRVIKRTSHSRALPYYHSG